MTAVGRRVDVAARSWSSTVMHVLDQLSFSATELAVAAMSGVGIYVVVIVMTRAFGQRSLSSLSTFDFPVTVAVGAIVGRTALVHTSLAGGAVALVLLFSAQALVTKLRNRFQLFDFVENRPTLLVSHGRIDHDVLRACRLVETDLAEVLRGRGVGSLKDVHALVLERDGSFSVITERKIDPWIVRNVRYAETLDAHAETPAAPPSNA